MTMTKALSALTGGFERPVLVFALRTAFAACAALFLGWLLGLEHPQWAAMTVWATSQPTRGQLLEKGAFRLGGTVVGVLAGVSLVLLSGGNIWLLVCGLALWITLCTAVGHLVRGFAVYGVILSGYSASMVSLLDNAHPDHVISLGMDRFLTIVTGVVVATLVGLITTPKGSPGALALAIRQVTLRLLRFMAQPETGEGLRQETRALLAEIAGLEEKLEPHGAGSRKGRHFVRSARALFMAEVETLLWLRGGGGAAMPEECRKAIGKAADALSQERPLAEVTAALDRAAACAQDHGIASPLGLLRDDLADHLGAPERPGRKVAAPVHNVILHRDWRGARSAGLRALLVMLVVGGLWALTGLESGPFLLLGLSIMISLFSTFENPAQFMLNVMRGQLSGAVGALVCRWLVWPYVDGSTLHLVLAMLPFIILGAFVMAHGRTRVLGFDYNMVFLLLLQPALPLHGTFTGSVFMAVAVVAAPLLALLAYRLLPVDAGRRDGMLLKAMLAELKEMAATGKPLNPRVRRARLHHRLLRMVQLGVKSGFGGNAAADRGFAIYGLGEIVLQIRLRAEWEGALERSLALVLRRMAELEDKPEGVARALDAAARRAGGDAKPSSAELTAAAAAVRRQASSLTSVKAG